MIFGKPLKEVEEQDIQRLVNNQIEENINLDYKKEIDLSSKGRKELCKDVSAFANSRGGVIIYGIEEKKNESGIPVPTGPIVGIDANIDREQVESILLNSIKPKFHFEPKRILLCSDPQKCVFVISIPQSLQAPHMVTKDKDNRYYKRLNFSSVLMEEYEVRDLFQRNAQMKEKISEIEKQRDGCLRDPNNDKYPWICTLFIPEIVLDDLLKVDEDMRHWLSNTLRTNEFKNFIDSVRPCSSGFITKLEIKQKVNTLIKIDRNGVLEWGSRYYFVEQTQLNTNLFSPSHFTKDLIGFLHFAGEFYEKVNYFASVRFVVGFNNVDNWPVGHPSAPPLYKFNEPKIYFSRDSLASQFIENHNRLARDIMDRVFNAFGETKCTFL